MALDPGEEPTPRERWAALVILSLFLLHGIGGFVSNIPAWRMFVDCDRYEYELHDRDGRPIDLRDYVHREVYLTDHQLVPLIAFWIADTAPERTPLRGAVTVHDPEATRVKQFSARPGESPEWSPTVEDPTGRSSSTSKGSGS